MPTQQTSIQRLKERYDAATTAAAREAILLVVVRYAERARTKAGAATIARLFPDPGVQAAAAAEWQRRAEELDDVFTWLTGVDEWCATLTAAQQALLPVDCWPTRLGRAALNWSEGRGGASPAVLRKKLIAAQALVGG